LSTVFDFTASPMVISFETPPSSCAGDEKKLSFVCARAANFSKPLAVGLTNHSISACVNSRCRVNPARGAISFRKALPTCATPNGTRLLFCSRQYL